jgi:hypothetical protein
VATVSPLPIVNAARIEPTGFSTTGRDQWGYSVKLGSPLTLAQAAALAADFITNVLPIVITDTSNRFTYDLVHVHDLLRPEAVSQDFPITSGGTGTIDATILDATSAPIITSETGHAGKSYRGRLYLPGLPVGEADLDQVTTGYKTVMQDIGTLLLEVATRLPGIVWGVPSKKLGLITAVLSFIARNIIGGQSRRRKGVGSLTMAKNAKNPHSAMQHPLYNTAATLPATWHLDVTAAPTEDGMDTVVYVTCIDRATDTVVWVDNAHASAYANIADLVHDLVQGHVPPA